MVQLMRFLDFKLQSILLSTSVDVDALLNQSTSADKGALSEVDSLVKEYGSGIYNIGRNVFVYIVVICLLISAACLVLHGNNVSKRSEEKSGIGWKIAGGIIGFAAASIVVLMQTIGESLL